MGYLQALLGTTLVLAATAAADYVAPSDYNRRPSTSYGTPAPSYGAPSNSYVDGHSTSSGYDAGYKGDERPKSYQFGYAVKDHASGNDFGRHETSDGDTVKGQYRVQLPDGRTQVVTYTADWKHGFQAKVTYEGEAFYPDKPQVSQGYDYTPAGSHSNQAYNSNRGNHGYNSHSNSNNINSINSLNSHHNSHNNNNYHYNGGGGGGGGGGGYDSGSYHHDSQGDVDSYSNFGSSSNYNDYSNHGSSSHSSYHP